MNILFLTLFKIDDISQKGIYPDLIRVFITKGHKVHIVSPIERRFGGKTQFNEFDNYSILKVKTLNIQKSSLIEKGFGTILLEIQLNRAINKYLKHIEFDLVIYSTPPITLTHIIKRVKSRYNSKTYLLLKDIFPQNAVDIGMLSKTGLIYHYFRSKEKKLYQISDYIGCMSPANVKYLIKHNPTINSENIEVCPNSIALNNNPITIDKIQFKKYYGIPTDSIVFVYGGNLGKPQGLHFFIEVLNSNINQIDRFFIIIGSGTEYNFISKWVKLNNPSNVLLLDEVPKEEYDRLLKSCDVGLIFLDPRFTIPNYPSRLLSYLENKMPVLFAIDNKTDIGTIAEKNGYGLWCENGDLEKFNLFINKLISSLELRQKMGEQGYIFLKSNYTVNDSYDIIISHFQ